MRSEAASTLGCAHAMLVHTEVVSDLMPQRVQNELFQVFQIVSHSLMGFLKDRNSVGQHKRFADAAKRERPPFIKAE